MTTDQEVEKENAKSLLVQSCPFCKTPVTSFGWCVDTFHDPAPSTDWELYTIPVGTDGVVNPEEIEQSDADPDDTGTEFEDPITIDEQDIVSEFWICQKCQHVLATSEDEAQEFMNTGKIDPNLVKNPETHSHQNGE